MSTITTSPSFTVYDALPRRKTPGWSSSMIVKVAVALVPSWAPPVGVPSVSSTLRLPSSLVLLTVGIMNDCLVTLGANVRVPETGPVKSTPGTAVRLEML